MTTTNNEETVYIFEHEGRTFEVDHLTTFGSVGSYAVYEADRQLSEFGVCDANYSYPVPVACEPGEELKQYALDSLRGAGEL